MYKEYENKKTLNSFRNVSRLYLNGFRSTDFQNSSSSSSALRWLAAVKNRTGFRGVVALDTPHTCALWARTKIHRATPTAVARRPRMSGAARRVKDHFPPHFTNRCPQPTALRQHQRNNATPKAYKRARPEAAPPRPLPIFPSNFN